MAVTKKAATPRKTAATKAAPKPAPQPVKLPKPKRFHAVMWIEGIYEADTKEAINAITAAAQRAWEKPSGINAVEVRARAHVVSTRERGLPHAD